MLTITKWILKPFVWIFPIGILIAKIALTFLSDNTWVIEDQGRKCGYPGILNKNTLLWINQNFRLLLI